MANCKFCKITTKWKQVDGKWRQFDQHGNEHYPCPLWKPLHSCKICGEEDLYWEELFGYGRVALHSLDDGEEHHCVWKVLKKVQWDKRPWWMQDSLRKRQQARYERAQATAGEKVDGDQSGTEHPTSIALPSNDMESQQAEQNECYEAYAALMAGSSSEQQKACD